MLSSYSIDKYRSNKRILDFKLKPTSNTVGPFVLGTRIGEVFDYLCKHSTKYSQNQFYYNEADPLSMPYVINLTNSGVSLRFESKSQRLESVKFEDLSKVDVSYHKDSGNTITFSTPENIATMTAIYSTFGPTNIGHFEEDNSKYLLEYPGLVFVFAVPKKFKKVKLGENPEPSQELYKIQLESIYCRSKDPTVKYNEDKVWVNIGQGITIAKDQSTKTIPFGASVQEVVEALGVPQDQFRKQEDTMSIYKKVNRNQTMTCMNYEVSVNTVDYFFNYFDLGLDILFDGRTHVAKKFILNTNLPSQPHFVTYRKCHYEIKFRRPLPSTCMEGQARSPSSECQFLAKSEKEEEGSGYTSAERGRVVKRMEPSGHAGKEVKERRGTKEIDEQQMPQGEGEEGDTNRPCLHSPCEFIKITPEMRWHEIEQYFGQPLGLFWAPSPVGTPFDGTGFYAYKNLIFEVTKKNGYVSKIFLFNK